MAAAGLFLADANPFPFIRLGGKVPFDPRIAPFNSHRHRTTNNFNSLMPKGSAGGPCFLYYPHALSVFGAGSAAIYI